MPPTINVDAIPVTSAADWQPDAKSPRPRPPWIRVRAPSGETYERVRGLMRSKTLHTVCEEAQCPNLGECWGKGTATFLMLGDTCTRSCGFCDIKTGRPSPVDWGEPNRIAESVRAMGLQHVVITSVNRDERADGGAPLFALVIRRIRQLQPGCSVEVLIPDFKGSEAALQMVMDAQPEILNHNVETVPRLFKRVQPQDRYDWALSTLENAKRMDKLVLTKSGIMLGLGETLDELRATMADLVAVGVDILTLGPIPAGQASATCPSSAIIRRRNLTSCAWMAWRWASNGCESGPLVRSSYRAAEQVRELSRLNHFRLHQARNGKTPAPINEGVS